jgi:uncharacterized protein YegL/molecular chaperone DnaK (HSP70)
MSGEPIKQLNLGVTEFKKSLQEDKVAANRVEVAIVTFGPVKVLQDFTSAQRFNPPSFDADGPTTPMGDAIQRGLNLLETRIKSYQENQVPYRLPWVFLITDGSPNSEDLPWQEAAQRVNQAEAQCKLYFWAIGVKGADMEILKQIAPRNRPPEKIEGLDFESLFRWMSQSLKRVATGQDIEKKLVRSSKSGNTQRQDRCTMIMDNDNPKPKLYLAIDFGTSRSGYAYGFADENTSGEDRTRIRWEKKWPDALPRDSAKTLTQILYSPTREVAAWGFQAVEEYARLQQEGKEDGYILFEKFKMALYKERKNQDEGELYCEDEGGLYREINGQKFYIVDVISDYLREIKKYIYSERGINCLCPDEEGETLIKDSEILWCLTLPAIAGEEQKQLMRLAAKQAGLIKEEDSPNLVIVLEPEAAALDCQQRGDKEGGAVPRLQPGQCFMVVNCGRDRVDITVQEVQSNRELEIIAYGGGAFGSAAIDTNFEKYLKEISQEDIELLKREHPLVYYTDVMLEWETKKCNFNPQIDLPNVSIKLSHNLFDILQNKCPEFLNNLAIKQQRNKDKIKYITWSKQTMISFYENPLNNLVEEIRKVLNDKNVSNKKLDYIYLVGGYSNSILLQQKVEEVFGERVGGRKNIIKPFGPEHSILRGAVAYGLDPPLIRARRSRFTYGIECCALFQPGIDDEKRKFRSPEGEWLCGNIFEPICRRGDIIDVNKEYTLGTYTTFSGQPEVIISIYKSLKKSPRYTDEDGVEKMGEIKLPMPNDQTESKQWIEVIIHLGGTQMKVEAKDLTTGKQESIKLLLSYTYFFDIEKIL